MALNLFWIFFKVGLFCFGGGNAMISVFEKLLVTDYGFMDIKQFADMVAISQITPGPVAVNLATYAGAIIGSSFAGSVFYSAIATLGISAPSFIIVVAIVKFFNKFGESGAVKKVMSGIKPAVIGLVAGSVLLLCRYSIYDHDKLISGDIIGAINFVAVCLAIAGFLLGTKTKINPAIILIASGFIGIILL